MGRRRAKKLLRQLTVNSEQLTATRIGIAVRREYRGRAQGLGAASFIGEKKKFTASISLLTVHY